MKMMGLIKGSMQPLRVRHLLSLLKTLGKTVFPVLIIWMALICITGTKSPVLVVLSGSMEPGFKRGDILFIYMNEDPIRAGEIVVFNIKGKQIPIVHRVIQVHDRRDSRKIQVLTKGDNNYADYRAGGIYASRQLKLQRQHIIGRAAGFLSYVGWVFIILTENPVFKYVVIGGLSLLHITSTDSGIEKRTRTKEKTEINSKPMSGFCR